MSAGWSSTRKAQPWLKPALGARTALARARSTKAGSTGVSAYSRIMRRRRTTSWNSMGASVPDHFEDMWRTIEPLGRGSRSGGYFRQPFAERRARARRVVRRAGDGSRAAGRDRPVREQGRLVGRRCRARRAGRVAPGLGARRRCLRRSARRRLGARGGRAVARARLPAGAAARGVGVRRGGGVPVRARLSGVAAGDRRDRVVAGPCAAGPRRRTPRRGDGDVWTR